MFAVRVSHQPQMAVATLRFRPTALAPVSNFHTRLPALARAGTSTSTGRVKDDQQPRQSASSASPLGTAAGPEGNYQMREDEQAHKQATGKSSSRDEEDRGERGRRPFSLTAINQFPGLGLGSQGGGLSSLIPSPLRSLFGGRGRQQQQVDPFQAMFEDPFFTSLSPTLPMLGASLLAPDVSRGAWDFDAELINPVKGIDLQEDEDKFIMSIKLATTIPKRDVHVRLVKVSNSDLHQLHMWGEIEKRQKRGRRGEAITYESFHRFITLPESVDIPAVEAKFDDHTLRIDLPKKEQFRKEEEGPEELLIKGRDEVPEGQPSAKLTKESTEKGGPAPGAMASGEMGSQTTRA